MYQRCSFVYYISLIYKMDSSVWERFRPDCIFLSAGFDAHKKDTINAGYIALVCYTMSYDASFGLNVTAATLC